MTARGRLACILGAVLASAASGAGRADAGPPGASSPPGGPGGVAPASEEPGAEEGVDDAGSTKFGEDIEVVGHYRNQVGTSEAASAGSYTSELIEDRPLLRPGEVEELVPGLVVTQHSGAGKANQYYLRGFNLDHGTDFATKLEGIPVNLPTNAHGQGYSDLNFLIPELVTHADYWKGPYYASNGDFSSAGAEDIYYAKDLPRTLLLGTIGSFDYYRALGAASPDLGEGKLLLALEAMHENGPWEVPEDYRKFNGVLRWTRPLGGGTLTLLAMGYSGDWNATDQVPLRAIDDGHIGRFGSLSPSDGGSARRYSLSAEWDGEAAGGRLRAYLYVVNTELTLWSNFTYFLDDPVNGDQMEQTERRWFEGASGSWSWAAPLAGVDLSWQVGWDGRVDEIDPLGLYHTVNRQRIGAWSVDDVLETNGSLWGQVDARATSWLHLVLGLRGTLYYFDVQSSNVLNSGTSTAGLLLPKATVVLGPWARTELFVNFGEGYHSNDARGVTATVDAKTGARIQPVTPLVKSVGFELGVRTEVIPHLQSSLDFWLLDLDSELVWDADNGTTAPSGPTRRVGFEWSTRYQPVPWLLFDLDACYSRARYTQNDPAGQYVPEAIQWVVSAGASIHDLGPWSASLFMRYFGPRALTQDGTIWSSGSTLFNGQVSYQLTKNVRIALEGFNLLNAKVDDIAYYYPSRLPWEPPLPPSCLPGHPAPGTPAPPCGTADYNVHPAEPLSFRGSLIVQL